tara:strand:+ start:121 stop:351 length:231 start_codon:yes stop_codon:yes gene_type:complete
MIDDHGGENQVTYSVHEVYYAKDGSPEDYSKMPETMLSDDLEEIFWCLENYIKAFALPMISIPNFPKEVPLHENFK